MAKVFIGARSILDLPGPHWDTLRNAGVELAPPLDVFRPLTEQELIDNLDGVVAFVAGSDHFTERVFAAHPQLKIVARVGVGYDQIDVDAATRHGVWITITPGANNDTVADYAFAMILAVARQLVEHAAISRDGGFHRIQGVDVCNKTLGILGLGRIGKSVARRASGFNMRVLAYDVMWDDAAAKELGVEFAEPEALFAEADFISVHLPSTPETVKFVNADRLARMKPSAYIVNTARGSLVDEEALVAAIDAGQLAGAASDVFSVEPPPADHPFLTHPKILPFPHVAGVTQESVHAMVVMAFECLIDVIQGRRPPYPVDEQAGYETLP
ncbi:MAG: phosphoglycerate dehydrogenase [Chloroflexi bacterium]|nr:phosphoglycerate dehydrogenase [Chloroflexota bacterium]